MSSKEQKSELLEQSLNQGDNSSPKLKEFSLMGGQELVKALRNGEFNKAQLRTIPPQQLYVAIQTLGRETGVEILEFLTAEQYQVLLDLDFWYRDNFQSDHFLRWLRLIDQEQSLEPIEQFLRSIDLELLALAIARYVHVISYDEPVEIPPDNGYYTPDHGFTWLTILIDDQDDFRVMARLLAYLFQRDPARFYSLTAEPRNMTGMELEERCFQAKEYRLVNHGIPEQDIAWRIHTPLSESSARKLLEQLPSSGTFSSIDQEIVRPALGLEPFSSFFYNLHNQISEDELDGLEAELARISNAALVFIAVSVEDLDLVKRISNQVRGAINIGLERISQFGNYIEADIYRALNLRGVYQLGLDALHALRRDAHRVALERLDAESMDAYLVRCSIDVFPNFVDDFDPVSMTWSDPLTWKTSPYEHVAQIQAVRKYLGELRSS